VTGDQTKATRPLTRTLVNLLSSLVVLALLAPLLADLLGNHFNNLGARTTHGIFISASWVVNLISVVIYDADNNISTARVLVIPVVIAAALTLFARQLDPQPGSPPTTRQKSAALPWMALVGLPALLLSLSAVIFGVALEPYLVGLLWLAAIAGCSLGRRRRRAAMAHERSLSGLPVAAWNTDHVLRFFILLAPVLSCFAGVALTGNTDGSTQSLALLEQMLGDKPEMIGLYSALTLLGIVLLAGPTRRALSLMVWEPPLAALLGAGLVLLAAPTAYADMAATPALGAAVALSGCALGGAGAATLPLLTPHPLRAASQLVLPLMACLSCCPLILATGLLNCDAVRADPRVEVILAHRGATSLEPSEGVHPSLFVGFPDEGLVTRISFKGGADRGVDLAKLPEEILDPSLNGISLRSQLLGTVGPDEVLVLATAAQLSPDPEPEDSVIDNGVLIAIDSLTSLPLDTAVTMDSCSPRSFAWHPFHALALVGCGDRGEVAMFEPTLHRFIAQQTIPSVPEIDSLLVDLVDGTLLLLPRRRGAFLVRYDLTSSKTLSWRFIGGGNHDLTQDIDGSIYLPRFLSRHVLVLEGDDLRAQRTLPGVLGMHMARPVLGTDILLTASQLTGRIYGLDMTGESPTRSLRLGGLLRDVRISADGSRAFTAGMCGVLSVDIQAWLDGPEL